MVLACWGGGHALPGYCNLHGCGCFPVQGRVCCCGRVIVSHADVRHGKSTLTGCFGRAAVACAVRLGARPFGLEDYDVKRHDTELEDVVFVSIT